jgi:hypothetical protein
MARRVSGGLTGSPSVGALNIAPTAVVTAADDQDITISPTGTGRLLSTADFQLQAQSDLRFADADSSNYVAFQSPATVASNVTWTLPNADGSNNQVLTTNASGTLSWTSKDVAIVDQTSSATTHYVTLTTATSGVAATLNTSSTKLSFQPSTGVMTVAGISGYAGAVAIAADNTTNATRFPIFVSAATGNLTPTTDDGYTYNPNTGTLTAVILTASSDERLKENVRPITGALSLVKQLEGVLFNRIGQTAEEIGVIAQQVEKIVPQLVHTDDKGMKSVAYANAVALLIEAVKEQQNQIEELKGRLA